jgi:hypothetical protein
MSVKGANAHRHWRKETGSPCGGPIDNVPVLRTTDGTGKLAIESTPNQ